MKEYSVKEVAKLFEKHEETIKRWLRAGKFPNAYIKSDKEGWKIPEGDLGQHFGDSVFKLESKKGQAQITNIEEKELIKLAYQAVTLTSPTDEIFDLLSMVGIKRTLEVLLIMQQSANRVKNPDGFIKKAIRENWNPSTSPVKLPKKRSKCLVDFTQTEYNDTQNRSGDTVERDVLFYNWLEQ